MNPRYPCNPRCPSVFLIRSPKLFSIFSLQGSLSKYHARIGYRFAVEDSVYIAKPHRGNGVGKALLAPLIQAARERNLLKWPTISKPKPAWRRMLALLSASMAPMSIWLDVVYMELLL